MNPLILLLILATAISSPMSGLGIISGIAICFLLFERGNYKNSSIVWHMTHWSWWDIRI